MNQCRIHMFGHICREAICDTVKNRKGETIRMWKNVLAVNYRGEIKAPLYWTIVAWAGIAEYLELSAKKGTLLYVDGRPQPEKKRQGKNLMWVVIDRVEILDGKAQPLEEPQEY